jgi:hypothetical protein
MTDKTTQLEEALEGVGSEIEEFAKSVGSPSTITFEVDEAPWPRRLEGGQVFNIRTLLYGHPGVGKTTLAASAPGPLFLIADPQGGLSIANSGHLWWEIENLDSFREAWGWMVNHLDEFDTIVVDSVTHLADIGRDELVHPTTLELDRRLWGKSGRQMRGFFFGLMRFPKDIIFICDERPRDDPLTRLVVTTPDLSPAQARLLNRMCRLVARLIITPILVDDVRVLERRLLIHSDGTFWAKDSSGRLPGVIRTPNLTDVFAKMRGGPPSAPIP